LREEELTVADVRPANERLWPKTRGTIKETSDRMITMRDALKMEMAVNYSTVAVLKCSDVRV